MTSPASPAPESPGAGSPATGRPSTGSPGPTGPPSRSKVPAPATSAPAGVITLTGTIEAGVEMNCLLLDGHLLVGGPRELLRAGARVSVTGRVQPGLMSFCQQGTPFLVDSARPA